MISIEYANAYTEVLEILNYIPPTEYQKIPKNKIMLLKENANRDHLFFYNPVQTLEEQNVSKIARSIIAIFFRDYWASDSQKEKIIYFQKNVRQRLEEKKREKYNPDDIFKKVDIQESSTVELAKGDNNIALIQYKETFFTKLKNIIFKILHINK